MAKRNDKHSFQDYTGRSFVDDDPAEWSDSEIVGTQCSQEADSIAEGGVASTADPRKSVFPDDMQGVTFIRCDLTNCHLPAGNTIGAGCCVSRVREQTDRSDWVVDDAGRPVEPLDKKLRNRRGVSVDPADLPARALTRLEHEAFRKTLNRTPVVSQ